jgi:hypothetical protein
MNIVSRKLEIGIFFSLIFFFSLPALCDCSAVIIQLCVLTEQENQFFTTSTSFSHKVQSQSSHSLACFCVVLSFFIRGKGKAVML